MISNIILGKECFQCAKSLLVAVVLLVFGTRAVAYIPPVGAVYVVRGTGGLNPCIDEISFFCLITSC